MKTIQFIGIIICLWPSRIEAKRDYLMDITAISCEHNISVIKSFVCRLERQGLKNILFGSLVTEDEVFELKAHVTLDLYMSDRRTIRGLDVDIDACTFLQTVHKDKFLNIFAKMALRYLNVYPKCPLKANFNYTLQNFHYDEEDFPLYLPNMKIRGIIRAFLNKDFSRSALIRADGGIVPLKKKPKGKSG